MIQPVILQSFVVDMLSDLNIFMLFMIGVGAGFGAFSRKLSVSAYGGLLVYVYIVINTDLFIYNAIMYLVLFIVLLWVSSFVISGYLSAGSEGEV